MSNFTTKFIPAAGKATTVEGRKREAQFVARLDDEVRKGLNRMFFEMYFAISKFNTHAEKVTKTWSRSSDEIAKLGLILIDMLIPEAASAIKKMVTSVELKWAIDQAFNEAKTLSTKTIKPKSTDFPSMIKEITGQIETKNKGIQDQLCKNPAGFLKKNNPPLYQNLWAVYNSDYIGEAWLSEFNMVLKKGGYPMKDGNYCRSMLASMLSQLELFRMRNGFNITSADIGTGSPQTARAYGNRQAIILAPGKK
jgi:hypothetical protein